MARDRVGKKPLHYTLVGRTLVFGSEIKSLLQHPGVKREVNLQAISDFLSFGYVPDPATAFTGVRASARSHADIQRRADQRAPLLGFRLFRRLGGAGSREPEAPKMTTLSDCAS